MASVKEALAKKGGLTLSSLKSYDDLITDALVDQVYFWTTIRKNKERYAAARGIREEEVPTIIRNRVIVQKDPQKATEEILKMTAIKRYRDRLGTDDEKQHFERHLRKYVDIYLPSCPFEVTTTNRYTIVTHEASISARREIKKGEAIKHLVGIQVEMTEEEEAEMKGNRDFSIVVSSRKKRPSLFLGPARFANHDCNANAKLDTTGSSGMQVVAVRNIEVGQEITVSYGENYFGEDNEECLCSTCEKLRRNGWKPKDGEVVVLEPEQPTLPADASGYTFRQKRKYLYEDTPSRDGTPAERPNKRRKKIETDSPAPTISARELRYSRRTTTKVETKSSKLREEISVTTTETTAITSISTPATSTNRKRNARSRKESASTVGESGSPMIDSPARSSTAASLKSLQSTPPTSVGDESGFEEDTIVVKQELSAEETGMDTFVKSMQEFVKTADETEVPQKSTESSELSDLDSDLEMDDSLGQVVQQRKIAQPRKRGRPPKVAKTYSRKPSFKVVEEEETIHVTTSTTSRALMPPPPPKIKVSSKRARTKTPKAKDEDEEENSDSDDDEGPKVIRTPGDYAYPNRNALLAKPHNNWVECQTCSDEEEFPYVPRSESWFVQENAYEVRKECPRCERHSKLYGYVWPKTDKESKYDLQERVMDHRTVYRFVEIDERRAERPESVERFAPRVAEKPSRKPVNKRLMEVSGMEGKEAGRRVSTGRVEKEAAAAQKTRSGRVSRKTM